MENHRTKSEIDRSGRPRAVPWESLEGHVASAFTLAGTSLLASMFVPIGLGAFVDWSWLVGIFLVGIGVLAVSLGFLGLYSRTGDQSSGLAVAGGLAAVVAGTAGLVLLALSGLTVGAMILPTVEFGVGMQSFTAIVIAMGGGYALGLLSFGILELLSAQASGRIGLLLTSGGILMLVPVVGALLQLGFGIVLPAWILFPVLGLVAVDTLVIGVELRSNGLDSSPR